MRSNQLKTSQDAASAVNSLAIVLPALAIVLFALAIWLARGRRRRALRSAGWSFVVVGLLLLLVRRIGGNEIVDSLVKVPSNEAAVHQAWVIATSLLFAIAVALIVYGVVFALAAWLGGPTRPARFLRKLAAPELRESPGVAYAAAGGLLLGLVVWGPTPAFRQLAWILVFAALLALGVSVLRRQTAVEFPGVQRGDAMREQRDRREAARARKSAAGAPAAAPAVPAPRQPVDELERLAALHDSGQLSDTEFATAKTRITNGT
jgi:MFS family permease